MIPDEVIEAVDAVVPVGVSHIGFVATNVAGKFLVTKPKDHPYGVIATISKVRKKGGERPSDTLVRCIQQWVGQGTRSVFPIPAVWVTFNGTIYYFAGMLWNEGEPPSEEIPGLQWLPRGRAEEAVGRSKNPTSRARDLGLISAVAGIYLSPYRRVLLMVRELHMMGFERLRVPAYEYPLAWRCPVVPATWTQRTHGGKMVLLDDSRLARFLGEKVLCHTYSSADGQHPFEWTEVTFADPSKLAQTFLRERRKIAFAG